MSHGEDLHMTEKHREIGPVLIDLDFRFSKEMKEERKYTIKHIEEVIKIYARVLKEYLQLPESYDVYVMEKPAPVRDKKYIKDGLHFVIPGLVTRPTLQLLVRQKVLRALGEVLGDLQLANTVEDVVDEAVIERNNWQMYGSKKPSCEPYKVTHVYKVSTAATESGELTRIDPPPIDKHTDLVEVLSIRNKFDETPTKIERLEELQLFIDKRKKSKVDMSKPMFKPNHLKNVCDNIDWVCKLVDILDKKRADDYESWIRVGWCLRNIDHRLLEKWIEFSKSSVKYTEGECERFWNMMRDDGLGIGTLCMWARQDNLTAYNALMDQDLNALILKSKSETHYDIAKVVHFIFRYDYVCVSIKNNMWYEFKNHRWVNCDCAFSLRQKISTHIVSLYMKAITALSQKAATELDEAVQKVYMEDVKKMNSIALKLKQSPFKDNIVKECRELFYIDKFEEKLDSRTHLIGFENGVYDLETMEFREGRPEDYVSMSTKIDYVPYDPSHSCHEGIQRFVSTIFPKEHIRDYVLKLMGSFLNGGVREEKFHIWTGVGSNGKSALIDLFERSFGEYCCKFPVTLLTMKRAASNAPTAEIARSKGRRFAVLQEPSEDEKMNVGLMKEMTGGDKIMARQMYKEPIEFKPQFKMVLTCNHLPNVPSDDGGTWRRIRVVEFTSRFCENPSPENPNEFPMDKDLCKKFEDWKEHFMALLIEYYRKYAAEGIKEPDEVMKCTRDYQRSNDIMMDFIEQEIDKVPGDDRSQISLSDIFTRFQQWVKDNAPQMKSMITKKTLRAALEKNIGKVHKCNGIEIFKECKLRSMSDNDLDDDLDL